MVKIVLDKKIKLKNPIVVSGFQGVGMVGTLASQYISTTLNAKPIGHIESKLLPPVAILIGGEVKFPIRIFADEKNNLVLFESELPIPKGIVFDLASEIVKWCKEIGAKQIICFEGVTVPSPNEKNVYAITNNKKIEEKISKHAKILGNGMMMGISAAIMLESISKKLPSVCIMVESHTEYPDGKAAASVIKTFSKLTGIEVDVKPLELEADKFEKKLTEIVKKAKEAKRGREKMIYG